MLLYELLERAVAPADFTHFQPKMGSQQIRVAEYITPEEQAAIDFNVPKSVLSFPVMYVYLEPMTGNQDRQDALKMRKQERFQTPEHETTIDNLTQQSIKQALQYDTSPRDARVGEQRNKDGSSNVGHTSMVSGYLRNSNAMVVPLPSSSKLSSMIAKYVAQSTGGTPVYAFQKQKPNWSAQSAAAAGKSSTDPRDEQIRKQTETIEKKTIAFMNRPKAMTGKQQEHERRLDAEIKKLETDLAEIKKRTHSQKSMYNNMESNRGAWYYGHFGTTEAAKNLNDKDIIIVDDNVYSGQTFAEAVKALLAAGIKPRSVVGFVLHKFS